MTTSRASPVIILGLVAILISVSIQQILGGEEVTITALPGYKDGRPCLQGCLIGGYVDPYRPDPQRAVACSRNSCLCRPDLQPYIYTALKSCIDLTCHNELELLSANSIFSGYCNAYYATAPPYPKLASSSPAKVTSTRTIETVDTTSFPPSTATPTLQDPVTVTQTLRADSTTIIYTSSSSSSHKTESFSSSTTSFTQPSSTTTTASPTRTEVILTKDSGDGKNQSDRIALGVGLTFGLLATGIGVLGLVFSWKQHKGIFKYRGSSESV